MLTDYHCDLPGTIWAGYWHTKYFYTHKRIYWIVGSLSALPGRLQLMLNTRYADKQKDS